ISIGMLLDISFVLTYPMTILLITMAVIVLKVISATVAAICVGVPLRTAFLVGIGLSQIGEFSFVLAKNGLNYHLADDYSYQLFLAVSLITMGLTPTLILYSSKIAELLLKLPFPSVLKTGLSVQALNEKVVYKNHTLIVGFGLSGRNLARASKEASLPYLILEMNAQTVKDEKRKGEPIQFGDATHISVLHHVNISEASVVAIVINDFSASCRIVELIRRINPNIYIIVRSRYSIQSDLLYKLGASDVVPDEIGTSIEIFTRVMTRFEVPASRIDEFIALAREGIHAPKDLRLKSAPVPVGEAS
nr:NAD-binding protein [Parachlamydiaceae bacterium]